MSKYVFCSNPTRHALYACLCGFFLKQERVGEVAEDGPAAWKCGSNNCDG